MKQSNWFRAAVLVCSALASGGEHAVAAGDENACMEGPMEQFGRYVGDWKIEDQSLAQDGSAWGPGQGGRWIFECIGDGVAVQDFWHPNSGGFGTNLRIYNPDTKQWEIVWTAKGLNGLTHISAIQDHDGNMRMDYVKPEQNPPRRITFMLPDENGWDWVMEISPDEGASWIAVFKIRATPWDDDE